MRAVRVSGPGRVECVEVPRPEAGPDDVMVRVEMAAICATDRRIAGRGADQPRILGHEVAGTLEDGAAVGVHPNVGCRRCEWCLAGFENRCARGQDIGIDRDGGLAEWVAVPRGHAVPLDGFDMGMAPLIEPLACIVHALSVLEVRAGDHALVVGAGSLGMLGVWALQAAGATVAVVQRSEERRYLAAELGADAVLAPSEDLARSLGALPRVALVTAPGVEALQWALDRVAVAGRVHAFASTPGGAPIDANIVHYRHIALVGSTGSTVADYGRAMDMARSGVVPLDRLPRATVPLARAPDVLLDPAPDPNILKVLVRP